MISFVSGFCSGGQRPRLTLHVLRNWNPRYRWQLIRPFPSFFFFIFPTLTNNENNNNKFRLITSPDRRLSVEHIKKHPFFYGVDWAAIRNIEAPFIPRLRSITDTSYFPTDELDQVPDEPTGGDTTGAHKELAFLGYVTHVGFGNSKTEKLTCGSCLFPQLYVQEVHDFFERFLIPEDALSYLWSRGGGASQRNESQTISLRHSTIPILRYVI